MNKENLMRLVKTPLIIISTMLYIGLFWLSVNQHEINSKSVLINDVSRLYPVYVAEIVKHDQVAGLQEALLAARNNNLKVSIAGSRHTQGGHTYYEDAVVLDMTEFNEIISLDQENKIITVQSGITWKEIQEYIAR
ncbi:MAG: FAD-dependent oxidoreductase [Chloroflexi bacterium]|nr:FAD-dependent oxidoreductase [Chloroflexota bacterium]